MATRFDEWEGDFLAHHGIKGQKWGVRRFQNPDGTLTEAGKKREQKNRYKALKKIYKETKAHKRYIDDTEAYNKAMKHIPKESVERVLPYDRAYDKAASRSESYLNSLRKNYQKTGKPAGKKESIKLGNLKKQEWEAMSKWNEASKAEASRLLGKYGNRKMPKATNETAAQFVRQTIAVNNWRIIDEERKKRNQNSWRSDHG